MLSGKTFLFEFPPIFLAASAKHRTGFLGAGQQVNNHKAIPANLFTNMSSHKRRPQAEHKTKLYACRCSQIERVGTYCDLAPNPQ